MTSDSPIIFSAPMIRALIDGRKTQTRRVLKPQPYITADGRWMWINRFGYVFPVNEAAPFDPGDRLWVREAHAMVPASAYRMSEGVAQAVNNADPDSAAIYREGFDRSTGGLRWRPSIHMPRWASRLTLTVTDVRVQRLQDISEADAMAEGVERCAWAEELADDGRVEWHVPGRTNAHPRAWGAFWELWNSLHGPEAWDANPWVAAISFTVRQGNIDHE